MELNTCLWNSKNTSILELDLYSSSVSETSSIGCKKQTKQSHALVKSTGKGMSTLIETAACRQFMHSYLFTVSKGATEAPLRLSLKMLAYLENFIETIHIEQGHAAPSIATQGRYCLDMQWMKHKKFIAVGQLKQVDLNPTSAKG